ncbi:MAG: amidohydrolase family protein [Actinomycetota bacterium]|nr:amidohydrolase family protein [Actinomycetota bacterium]
MTIAVVGGTLIDGTGHDPVPNSNIVIEDDRIVEVGSAKSVTIPRGAAVLDATDSTVIPGIIDCHVHSTYRSRDLRRHLQNPPTYNILASTGILRETLECGVTTVRDMGGADAGFRKAVDEGLIVGPRMAISIVMMSQSGGHGDSWVPAGFRLPKRAWLPRSIADGVEEVRKLTRELLMAGADFIKVCATGGITSLTDDYDESQMTIEEIGAAVGEAAARNKRVAAHAQGVAGIKNALSAGVYSIEHGWFMDEECVETMLRKGTWWVPTLALVPRSRERRRVDTHWSEAQLADEARKDEEIYQAQLKQVPLWKDAVKRGIKVAMGTDQSHRLLVGENLRELGFMVDWLGMSPMDTLVASTSRAAQCLERQEDLGTLEPGRIADVLVIDGDPLDDITILQERSRLRLIMKGGGIVTNHLETRGLEPEKGKKVYGDAKRQLQRSHPDTIDQGKGA